MRFGAAADGGTAEESAPDAVRRWLCGGPGRFVLSRDDPDYPPSLLHLNDPPPALFGVGRRDLLRAPALAIVGSRNATEQGRCNARAFSGHLARVGYCIVSGMARGIDSAAHWGALDAGGGTIAVLGTGIDIVYPPSNRPLAEALARDGLLIAEFPPGMGVRRDHFPRRNRIIAALARGVLVAEATLRSGSLITARWAADLGREVFALPGSIHAPMHRGCHRLIRDGAKLVESAQDILEEFHDGGLPDPAAQPARARSGGDRRLAAMGYDPVDLDTLAARLREDPGSLAAALLELELMRKVERLPGNRYQRLV